ncbi:MAG: hypothetical protein IIC56_07100 [Proteobacteria bacterium]|nr:hypothetical protein [Pseudomonadota bacterium]
MRFFTSSLLGALLIGSSFISTAAAAQPVCGSHGTVSENLKKGYAEAPVSMGVTMNGAVIEVFASEKGTWTLVITQPNGMSCLIAAGLDWESLPTLVSGAKI